MNYFVALGIGFLSASSFGGDDYAEQLGELPDASSLRAFHDLLGSEPHIAGTPGDLREIARLAEAFEAMGLDTEVHWFEALLPHPVAAEVEIVGSSESTAPGGRRGVIPLALREKDLLADPAVQHPGLSYGWNAFSGSDDVTGEVVYANFATKADFERLRELGVETDGRIVIARYGRNYRGYKVKFAQEAGAAGLLMYLDPADYGYERGETWPKGGWANATCIQRGSVLVLPYKGDPLTPFVEATADAERLSIDDIALPFIPVQPIGYAAASRILSRMKGRDVADDDWRGGLPIDYRLTGGEELEVRVHVEQDRRIRRSANVLATIKGALIPDEFIVVGCHHDAWGFGAADPLAGTIVLMETARVIAEQARAGNPPDRTIIFAAWGAEEFGIIGSSEWVEGNHDVLTESCVAYINLDMASMGNGFAASATPVLRAAIGKALLAVPQAGEEDSKTLADTWAKDGLEQAYFGDLGGGSDHVGFVCHAGVPAIALSARGAEGTAYHSNYDTLAWYRATIGEDYASALMVTRACARVVGALSNSFASGYDWNVVAPEIERHATRHLKAARKRGLEVDLVGLSRAVDRLAAEANALRERLSAMPEANRVAVSQSMLLAERAWLDPAGLSGRPWYRNTYICDDPESGYAASVLPELHQASRDGDAEAFLVAVSRLCGRIDELADRVKNIGHSSDSES